MMRRIIEVEVAAEPEDGWLLAPKPFGHWGERLIGFDVDGAGSVDEASGRNSGCCGYVIASVAGRPTRLRYELLEDPEATAPDWVWRVQENRYTRASDALMAQAREAAAGAETERAALSALCAEAASVFGYGHVERKFNEGCETVPAVCGTARGSCVDINTFILAAAQSLGLRGQYVAGYWFHPEKTETGDMHCWLAFEPDGELVFWDVAHGLKWAETLGARVQEGLNPAGGRRVGMSVGRGLEFETPVGVVEISHFSEPVRLRPGGVVERGDFGPFRLTETAPQAPALA